MRSFFCCHPQTQFMYRIIIYVFSWNSPTPFASWCSGFTVCQNYTHTILQVNCEHREIRECALNWTPKANSDKFHFVFGMAKGRRREMSSIRMNVYLITRATAARATCIEDWNYRESRMLLLVVVLLLLRPDSIDNPNVHIFCQIVFLNPGTASLIFQTRTFTL